MFPVKIVKCSIEGCLNKRQTRGWCVKHYTRWHRHGDPNVSEYKSTPEESFAARTVWQGDCLIWTGSLVQGYGQLWVDGRLMRAHRYAWKRVHGSIPPDAHIDHKIHCNPACVNIEHLRIATGEQNAANRSGASVNNKASGVRNVYRNGSGWMVNMTKGGKRHYFGTYRTIEEAGEVAEQNRKELFGAFAGRG